MKNRYYFIDNLRWVCVVLVLIYHVFYNFNGLGIFGALGGWGAGQWQDVVCTALNPWFMTLMFALAGASSRYALLHRTTVEFRKERVRKLLLPVTLGLFVFGWVLGVINISSGGGWAHMPAEMPLWVKYLIACVSGTGHLWFIQDLLGFSLLLLVVRRVVSVERVDGWLTRLSQRGVVVVVLLLFPLLWLASQSQVDNLSVAEGLLNLYRPIYYFVAFLVGYYLLSVERLHDFLARHWAWFAAVAVAAGVVFCTLFYGKDYTAPEAVQSLWCNLYCWSMVLAMMGIFRRWCNATSEFATYMTRSSFGIYVVHMAVCTGACWWLKSCALPIWATYVLALVVTAVCSVVVYEILHRVPFVRWAVFGIKKRK